MKYAFRPNSNQPMTPEAMSIWQKFNPDEEARCGKCNAIAFAYGVGSLLVTSRFNHQKDSGPCELKATPVTPNTNDYSGDGEALRAQFFQEDPIQFAFSVCQALVCGELKGNRFVPGNFNVQTFKNLLTIADKKHTWCLKGMTLKLLPFVLVSDEVFNIRYSTKSDRAGNIALVLRKTAVADSERQRMDRSEETDLSKPIWLQKYFVTKHGLLGSFVEDLDLRNPHVVSEENAIQLAGENWRRLRQEHITGILNQFIK